MALLVTGMLPLFGEAESLSLSEARTLGAQTSKYHSFDPGQVPAEAPEANLEVYSGQIKPLLEKACVSCHGPEKQKAKFRLDTLDPDLVTGPDVSWWLEVVDVLSNGEMPPPEAEVSLEEEDRAKIIDWLSREMQVASQVRRSESGHTSFRRLTRYEYKYALQDLLGLSLDLSNGLPPETASEDGFKNSSEMLQMSVSQFEQYRELARTALRKATVKGERPPEFYFPIRLADGAEKKIAASSSKVSSKRGGAVRTSSLHYFNRATGEGIANYDNNRRGRSHVPVEKRPELPQVSAIGLVVPGNSKAVFNLGSQLPEEGNLRVRVRASPLSAEGSPPRLRLHYGFQASNNSHDIALISRVAHDVGDEDFYEWTVALSELNRNPFRGQKIPKVNPTECILIENTTSGSSAFIDYVEVQSPAYESWPPASHTRLLPDIDQLDDHEYARKVLSRFLRLAWRRPISPQELERKVELYQAMRPDFEDRQDALIEVLANVLASPHFLYLVRSQQPDSFEIVTRLSSFLWSSIPDEDLLALAEEGKVNHEGDLEELVNRMLADPRSARFSRHFVRQWLGMDLLDYLDVDRKVHRGFTSELRDAMQQEPIAFFREVLEENRSIIDFLHADYVVVNAPLAKHYQISEEGLGGEFQPVAIRGGRRGGLLTQAGLLSMNSDGKDSHPLKRGVWLLENVLNDPPPPPPPSVPEIDLADPRILQMTLKERMEDHRNDPACLSCHARIDPWGVAFENFDAVGAWRDSAGKSPIDATATLFNREEIEGIEGLKRYLLLHRQDQFARAMVHKLAAYALGRPVSFADHSHLEEITARLRGDGDGLATLIALLVSSDLFLN